MHLNCLRVHMVSLAVALIVTLTLPGCVSAEKSGNRGAPGVGALATVMFQSTPGDAEVYVNGDFRGTTPLNLRLTAGTQTVELKLEGFVTWKRDLLVVAGDDTRVAARLEPE